MRFACQVLATWDPEGNQSSSRVYVNAEDGLVSLWLPGQGSITLNPGDARTIGEALVEAANLQAPPDL